MWQKYEPTIQLDGLHIGPLKSQVSLPVPGHEGGRAWQVNKDEPPHHKSGKTAESFPEPRAWC